MVEAVATQGRGAEACDFDENDARFMRMALDEARTAMADGEVPVGCVLVADGEVLARGGNQTNRSRNGTRHCELVAADEVLGVHGREAFARCRLYVTLEPCIMCAGALQHLGVTDVVYGGANSRFGGCGGVLRVHETREAAVAAVAPEDVRTVATAITSASSEAAAVAPGGGADAAAPPAAARGADAPRKRGLAGIVCRGGLLGDEAVELLKGFYATGNPLAPAEKRHRPLVAGGLRASPADTAANG
eukprot:TRINITY_DN21472_c0_g1_i1.p1 TRINITY_DN21472_c0_g1~~TRINITY_DN21472_c0_g1_i1.p1  ORF type:complete len:247 (-),score=61.86 TRINITY_DN21472_c0_g1_i1:138-878(-)